MKFNLDFKYVNLLNIDLGTFKIKVWKFVISALILFQCH